MFPFAKRTKDGYYCWCKPCSVEKSRKFSQSEKGKAFQEEYKTSVVYLKMLEDRKTNEELKAYRKEYSKTDKFKESQRTWRQENKSSVNFWAANRRAAEVQATPDWLTEQQKDEIKEFYQAAKDCEWLSDEKLNVDHIIPLQGIEVCGLHVPWNLQVIPERKNFSKGNRLKVK